MLYNTLVLPLFDYCSPVWYSCGVGSKTYFDKLNRCAACIIEGRSIGVEELKSILGWPSLQARRNYLKCVLVHKCLHEIAPSYLLSEFRYAHFFHGYNTSRILTILPQPFNLQYFQNGFFCHLKNLRISRICKAGNCLVFFSFVPDWFSLGQF